MKQKLLTGGVFVVLITAGALTASALGGREPLQVGTTSSTSTIATTTTTTTTTTTPTTTITTTPARRIRICHHARGKKGAVRHVTLRISRSAWTAHRRHGDSLGACSARAAKKFHARPAHVKKFHRKKK